MVVSSSSKSDSAILKLESLRASKITLSFNLIMLSAGFESMLMGPYHIEGVSLKSSVFPPYPYFDLIA